MQRTLRSAPDEWRKVLPAPSVEALEKRDTERAGALALKHTLDLAIHVEKHVDYLD